MLILDVLLIVFGCVCLFCAGVEAGNNDRDDANFIAFLAILGLGAIWLGTSFIHQEGRDSGKGLIATEQVILDEGSLYRVVSYCEPSSEEVANSPNGKFSTVIQELSSNDTDEFIEPRYVLLSPKPDPNAKLFRAIKREGKLQLEAITP